ncbi:MAG TPA: nitrogenase iron-molybdenum cofactor biosynthesis protein NifN [Thiobacillus sp.]|nr:MAG: nitrogenase iron-molybdenum cofactor biosynthesis protein NifN [Hydrogenophilales bacterium 16-64-40]OZA32329.1 MAG: nitrogenase iron-molybdenum cofactor biosynthesis protein NifN [Hydrogenophilales bacterium 17-64-65]HQS81158.1 nitrogenase iron-molybdenum cofactor biosynthesis protein NifN [Thiobacillus sp.]HQT32844.1 nitrogenase iron-molybdenum cofactor biosynthesis protein NifN [Thiobacillus sp.]
MAIVTHLKKSCAVNPLKMSQPIGAALAFMGLNNCMPTLHGSQGCTAFGLVLFVRHFKEAVPMQTTAMNEATTIMGGYDNVEQAILNIHKRAQPAIIGIASTGLTETKGDDVDGYLALIRKKHPELDEVALVYVSTPDYVGAFQDGWAKAVAKIVKELAEPGPRIAGQVNVLAGSHLTPGDLEEVRELVEAFGLTPIILPDLSGSLDGHIPDNFSPTTLGGTTLADLRASGRSEFTLAIGEHMREAAQTLQDTCGVPFDVLESLTGLDANDRLMSLLAEKSGRPAPNKYRRQRSQLMDAMLDAHFYFGGKKIAIGAEPDLLLAVGKLFVGIGAELTAVVTTTQSPVLEHLPAQEVLIGDLEDLEQRAQGCDLLVTHSHGRQMAERLNLPFLRMGIPMFDRLGAAHQVTVGYRGTRNLIFEVANMFMAASHEPGPDDWRQPASEESGCGSCTSAAAH